MKRIIACFLIMGIMTTAHASIGHFLNGTKPTYAETVARKSESKANVAQFVAVMALGVAVMSGIIAIRASSQYPGHIVLKQF